MVRVSGFEVVISGSDVRRVPAFLYRMERGFFSDKKGV